MDTSFFPLVSGLERFSHSLSLSPGMLFSRYQVFDSSEKVKCFPTKVLGSKWVWQVSGSAH